MSAKTGTGYPAVFAPLSRLSLLVLLAFLAHCAKQPPSSADMRAGARDESPATSDIAVAWYAQERAFADATPLRVRFRLDNTIVDVLGADLSPPGQGPWLESRRVSVPASGSLPVLVSYVSAGGDTLAKLEHVIARLAPGYHYGVTIYAGGRNPAAAGPSLCGGPPVALGVRRPGRTATDTLFIHIGGLPKGAVC